jgi:carboxyl-terminal processing protease
MFKNFSEKRFHLTLLAFLTGLFTGISVTFISAAANSSHKYLDFFHQTYRVIISDYVDEPDSKKMFYGAIKGMIDSLDDPFTRFLNEDEISDLNELTSGRFVGIGVEVAMRDGALVVISPIQNSPAFRAGIEAGDIITSVNDRRIKDSNFNEIIKSMKGVPGSKVKITIRREGYDSEISYDLERAPIRVDSVEYAVIKEHNTGYLRIIQFGGGTTADVKKALEHFKSNGIEKLVLDLRFNPGGTIDSAVEIAELFLNRDSVIASTKGRNVYAAEKIFRSRIPMFYTGKVVVLINRGSASASELLSGALRDNKRALLVGEKSFGKGSVQTRVLMDKDIGFNITIAKYLTPSGEMIHKKGITPDKVVSFIDFEAGEEDVLNRAGTVKAIRGFVNSKTVDDLKTREEFRGYLADKGIKLSEKTAGYILKYEVARFRKSAVYDLEFDNQLNTALKSF